MTCELGSWAPKVPLKYLQNSILIRLLEKVFKEPYSNNVCNHTFEKSYFLGYFKDTATVFAAPGQGRPRGQPPQGTKQARCPQSGCDKVRPEVPNRIDCTKHKHLQMLRLEDFYDDQLIVRKVQRMEKAAAQAAEDDDSEEDALPRGTQRNRPTQIDDDEDDDSVAEQEQRRRAITKIKRERQRSHSVHVARAAALEPDEEEVDAMDTD